MIEQRASIWAASLRWWLITLCLVGLASSSVFMIMRESKTGLALGVILVAVPVATYLAITRPILFPFGLYVVLVPFDNILLIPHWGTLTKLAAILSGVAVLFWVIRRRQVLAPRLPLIMWGALILWAAASLSWAVNLSSGYPVGIFTTLVQLFLLYVALSLLPITDRDLKMVAFCIVLGAVAASLYGIYLYSQGVNVSQDSRLFITVGNAGINPNEFAGALLLPIALALVGLLGSKRPLQKLGWLAALLILLDGIVITTSRGAILAIICMLLFLVWKSRYQAQMLAIIVLASVGSLFVPSIWARFSIALSTGGAGRLSIWEVGLSALKRHWLIGAGIGNFADAYDRAYLSVFQSFNAHWHRPAHDLLLGTAVELGVLGLVLMLVAWFAQYKTIDAVSRQSSYYDLTVALQAALVSLFVACLFLDGMYQKYLWLAFMFIMLLGARVNQDARERLSAPALGAITPLAPQLAAQTHPVRRDYAVRS